MKDRAQQALYMLALSPVAETLADPNSVAVDTSTAPGVTPTSEASEEMLERLRSLGYLQ